MKLKNPELVVPAEVVAYRVDITTAMSAAGVVVHVMEYGEPDVMGPLLSPIPQLLPPRKVTPVPAVMEF